MLVLEIQESRDILRASLDEPIRGFCYPYGVVSDAAIRAARDAGYDYAVATRGNAKRDRFAMPRTYVGERDGVSRLQAKRLRHWLTRGRP